MAEPGRGMAVLMDVLGGPDDVARNVVQLEVLCQLAARDGGYVRELVSNGLILVAALDGTSVDAAAARIAELTMTSGDGGVPPFLPERLRARVEAIKEGG